MQISLLAVLVLFPCHIVVVKCFTTQEASIRRNSKLPSLHVLSPDQSVVTAFVPRLYSPENARSFIDETLMPQKGYGERIGWGRDAQGLGDDPGIIHADDPRLSMTYAEFPLTSFDKLIERGLKILPHEKQQNAEKMSMVDLGSGCGRLVIYSAMTMGSSENYSHQSWNIQGIEIAELLHEKALEYTNQGIQAGILLCSDADSGESTHGGIAANTLSLNLGSAENFTSLLQNADIIFAYSTTFPAKLFSPELGALILDPEWSSLLGKACSPGCVAITTDRALDPNYGWELVDRLKVENPDVFGTTGYVHILRR